MAKKTMAKKKEMGMKTLKEPKCGCSWTGKDWFGLVLSEGAIYLMVWYLLTVLGATGNLWLASLVLVVLGNLAFFVCPVFRKHYM